ncbi:MAG TPA: hypothetical protein VMR81_06955 [Patescibacteria group bacterium]|nr:hypothetical protein [Patescibacteria group bacterium]
MNKIIRRIRAFCWSHKYGLIFISAALLLIRFMFRLLPNLYYVFDEWKLLGAVYIYGPLGELKLLTPMEIISGKARFLALLLTNISLYVAPFSALPFAIASDVVHLLNAILLYLIVKKISKSKFLAFFSGLFFITCSVDSQVFTWIGATYESLFALFFSLLAIWLYLIRFDYKRPVNTSLKVSSWICLLLAYYFKETSIVVLVLFFWFDWMYGKKRSDKLLLTVKNNLIPILLFCGIGFLRILTFYVIHGHPTFAQQTHPSIARIAFHLIYYPLTSLAHFYIPYDYMIKLSIFFYHFQYQFIPKVFSDVGETVLNYYIIADYLSFMITVVLIVAIYFLVLPIKKYRTLLFFAVLYYFLQHVPLALYDAPKGKAYFESRYYYVLLPSGAIFFSLLLIGIKNLMKSIVRFEFIAFLIICFVGCGYIYKQAVVMKRDVIAGVEYNQPMKTAMDQFIAIRPNLPDKPIILLTGNNTYFGEVDQFIPVLLNPGYALMVRYYKTGKIPGELILEPYHFDHGEGYRLVGNKAYGFYTQESHLIELLKSNPKLSINQVVGFYYDGATGTLKDDTQEVQLFLKDSLREY